MFTHKLLNTPFVRELLGMGGGALVALAVYAGYQQASGVVPAHLLGGEATVVDVAESARAENMKMIAVRVREILERNESTGVH